MARLTLRIGDRRKRIARFGGFVSTGPINTAPPAITGTPEIGQTLACSTGTWTGTGAINYARQWLRNGANISGATGATYTLVAGDDLATISCRITATDDVGSTAVVSAGVLVTYPEPANISAPVIGWVAGTEIGDNLQVTSNGTWTGGGLDFDYQWQRNGADLIGETGTVYTTQIADDDASIRCVVTATNSGGSASANSNAITINDAVQPVISGVPTISGVAEVGNTLTATAASVSGTPTPTRTWQWTRNGLDISGATANTYTLTSADYGATIAVRQIETNTAGVADATSADVVIAPFSPADLFGVGDLGGFWDVSEASSRFQTTDTSTPATTPGQNLSRLNDLSGNGNNWLLSAGQPVFEQDGDVSYMLLDGSDDAMATSSITGLIRRNSTLVLGIRYASGGSSSAYNSVFGAGSGTNYAYLGIRTNISGIRMLLRGSALSIGATNAPPSGTNTASADSYLLCLGRFRESDHAATVNGTEYTPAAHSWADGQNIDSDINTGVASFGVERRIVFAIYITRDLSSDELSLISAWAGAKLNP